MPLLYPKPERRQKLKARLRRVETGVKQDVRALVSSRDGYCRINKALGPFGAEFFGTCAGPSEWAHWGKYKRARTRNQAPCDRHTTGGTLMLCKCHHKEYDAGQIKIEARTARECDGALAYTCAGVRHEEEVLPCPTT